jgi:hypothetical protein
MRWDQDTAHRLHLNDPKFKELKLFRECPYPEKISSLVSEQIFPATRNAISDGVAFNVCEKRCSLFLGRPVNRSCNLF